MDELKKYLQENSHKMEMDSPPGKLFERIKTTAAGRKKAGVHIISFRIAAAACIAAGILIGIKLLQKDTKKEAPAAVAETVKPNNHQSHSFITKVPVDTLMPDITAAAVTAKQASAKAVLHKKQLPVQYRLLHSFEYNYTRLVNLQLKNIRHTPVYGEAADCFNDFKTALQQINRDEAVIKITIKSSGLNDELLEQLINVYQGKIDLLKNLQQEIARMNTKIKENSQPADSMKIFFVNI